MRRRTTSSKDLAKRRVKTPMVLQYEAVECGAACLKIVLGYLGKVISLAELRERCGIGRDGVSMRQIKKAGHSLGLECNAFRTSTQNLLEKGNYPCILFWNFNHFLVLEGFANSKAYLSDPASGRRRVDLNEFQQNFTGVVLELRPGENFQRGGSEPGLYRWAPALIAPYRSLLPWMIVTMLVGSLPELFIAGAANQFIDGFLQNGRQNVPIPVIWITGIASALLISLLSLQKLLLRSLSNLLLKRVGSLLFISLFSLPYRYFLQRMRGELATRLILPFSIAQLSVTVVLDFILSLGSGLLALLVGALISPWLALLTISIAGVNTTLTLWIRELRRDANYKLAIVKGEAQGTSMYALQCVESIKASGLENETFIQWSSKFQEVQIELQKQSLASSIVGLVGTTSGFLLTSGVLLLGGGLIIIGQLTLGELIAFQFLTGMITAPLGQLTLLSSGLQQLDGEVGRINDIIDSEVDPTIRSFGVAARNTTPSRKLQGNVHLNNLHFQFSNTSPMLFGGLNLILNSGQHLAIVGGSGSGKSTLLRLLAGLHHPTQGQILYDEREWLEWDDPTLRTSIALVSQDVFLFPATLMDNLTFWDPRFNLNQATVALEEAGLLDELGGAGALSEHLVEGGGNLSGGQRQRVEIARAMLREPSLLLMDEATSALDDRRERQIMANVKSISRTLITVAHRMHAAEISDWVLVLEQGQLVQQGHPRDLSSTDGPYRRLLEAELLHNSNNRRAT